MGSNLTVNKEIEEYINYNSIKLHPVQKEIIKHNEELGDIPTHFMKSGSCMPPKERLSTLKEFQRRVLPKVYRGAKFEFDLWFNTNELRTIRNWLYTDFLGGGIYIRVNTIKINDRVMHSIADSDIKIDEERIQILQWHSKKQ